VIDPHWLPFRVYFSWTSHASPRRSQAANGTGMAPVDVMEIGDHRAIGRDGIADEGWLVVVPQAEEGGPLGPVVDVVRRLGAQVVRHARRHGGRGDGYDEKLESLRH
jgi:hypothetical protein